MNRTENEIRNAFENATPDVLNTVLSHDCHEKGIVIPVTKRKFGHFMLKRIVSAIITLLIILGIVAVAMLILNGWTFEADEQVTMVEENGQKHLQLPASETQIFVPDRFWGQLDSVDYDLLKAADWAILEKIASHRPIDRESPLSPFYYGFSLHDGELYLIFEMLAFPEPNTPAPCGDHIHVIGRYPITK